ncbi:Uncharacterised protein [Afipia felis]|uniref:Uncharacterized protein n=2 Tax=Afipia felis TaxID=1035 RepID=A0A380WB84_AFIFE|nr:hypothetical protein HMPREF9697_01821 [Afipia felis ATCC 53690]SUU78001.1 Uncharacterised protein [Afipia felis]SUU86066.1 Uncharacterised protein [Afipia felis]
MTATSQLGQLYVLLLAFALVVIATTPLHWR